MSPEDTPEIERKVAAQLGQRLLKILMPLRVRCLSLHDAAGELLWSNEGEYATEIERQVLEVQPAFELDRELHYLERDDQERRLLFFCTRQPGGERSGLAVAMVSKRRRPQVDEPALRERVFTTLRRFSASEPLSGASLSSEPPDRAEPTPARRAALETARRLVEQDEALRGSLRLRPYVPLRSSSSARRFEIAESSISFLEHDVNRAMRLLRLLKRRGSRASPVPASFALPLCTASVLSDDFMTQLQPMLAEAAQGRDTLGFTVPAAAWELHAAPTERFLSRCAESGCFVCLDEFNLLRGGFGWLRAPAVRCLRIDSRICTRGPDDHFAHASVAAISKAARVLGLYCIATGVKAKPTARWLAGLGIEYADRTSRGRAADATTKSVRALPMPEMISRTG